MEPSAEQIQAEVVEPDRGSAWTIPLLCAGIAIIACCLLIPAADDNHRLVYEREKLRLDLEQIKKQISINEAYIQGFANNSGQLERLAQNQLKLVREGTNVLELKSERGREDLSPYMLVTLPPPAEIAPYRPIGGKFSNLCRQPRSQLFLLGGAMLLVATGLVLGASPRSGSAD